MPPDITKKLSCEEINKEEGRRKKWKQNGKKDEMKYWRKDDRSKKVKIG